MNGPGRLSSAMKFLFIVVTGSLLMVLYDLFREPAAMSLDMWSWKGDGIPARNYLTWFIFSALFHSVIRLLERKKITGGLFPSLRYR